MHPGIAGWIEIYGTIMFAIVCTFWTHYEIEKYWRRYKKWKRRFSK